MIASKRCKRATIPVLTTTHPDVVAQASKPAASQLSKSISNVSVIFAWGHPRLFPNDDQTSAFARPSSGHQ
jgi:hypothetical protein